MWSLLLLLIRRVLVLSPFEGNADHLKEFRDPKNLLYNAITRSLGLSDTSQLIQYSCTDHGAVKVPSKRDPLPHLQQSTFKGGR